MVHSAYGTKHGLNATLTALFENALSSDRGKSQYVATGKISLPRRVQKLQRTPKGLCLKTILRGRERGQPTRGGSEYIGLLAGSARGSRKITHNVLRSLFACISRGSQTPGSERASRVCRLFSVHLGRSSENDQ